MKIDKMFVISAPQSEESQKIAAAIVGLARALGLLVTAEGVEDQWTLSFLAEIGCDTAQGYFIGRPMPPDATLAWLMKSPAANGVR
jgi:EAL domain-containing protein (putative c-di-GMP-specific phosphodiesterase class I)